MLEDIKNAGIIIHNDSNGYYITSESETKYSALTDYAEKLNQLKILTVLSPEETEIARTISSRRSADHPSRGRG